MDCAGFIFHNQFDSANLDRVEEVEIKKPVVNGKHEHHVKNCRNGSTPEERPSYEFNIWARHDCHGTEYQNYNKTWFYFGVKAWEPGVLVKLNLVNLNKQLRMFNQGMSPVTRTIPGHLKWERVKDRPTFTADENSKEFVLSFSYRTSENPNAITYFAFTYPYSYSDLQYQLKKIDSKMNKIWRKFDDDIYYHRECAIKSLEGRRLDILTISSYWNISKEKEDRLKHLFPLKNEDRPFKFHNKKIIFVSARVHPGETPASFVFNGFLKLLLNREDNIAIALRRHYVFKLIPMLNPDGVAKGFYRMDTRGVNLNRMYLNPSRFEHPTIYAAVALIKYYHQSYNCDTHQSNYPSIQQLSKDNGELLENVTVMTMEDRNKCMEQGGQIRNCFVQTSKKAIIKPVENFDNFHCSKESEKHSRTDFVKKQNSALCLYIDMHGHASKKGIFMYGNHFEDSNDSLACMLLPKLMSINNSNFHFSSCNFTERFMHLIDKREGTSREGAGRVAVYRLTGLIHSYTLECNYNTGKLVNVVPAKMKDESTKSQAQIFIPPKYTPAIFEDVGAALGPSILDMTGSNPNSRLINSQYRTLSGVKSFLRLTLATPYQKPFGRYLYKNNGAKESPNKPRNVLKESKLITKNKENNLKIHSSLMNREVIRKYKFTSVAKTQFIKSNCLKSPQNEDNEFSLESISMKLTRLDTGNAFKKNNTVILTEIPEPKIEEEVQNTKVKPKNEHKKSLGVSNNSNQVIKKSKMVSSISIYRNEPGKNKQDSQKSSASVTKRNKKNLAVHRKKKM